MTDQLLQHIQKLVPGFTITQDQLAPFVTTRKVKKEEVLLNENEACHEIYFVNKGCLYLFYHHNDRKEVVHFALENWWITDYKTFADGLPSEYTIAAMEDAEITSMSRQQYEALLLQFPPMALYFNKIHERAYGAALLKQKTFAITSKPDFYRYFRTTYPTILQRIPSDIFASYMGVSTEMLQDLEANFLS